MNNIKINTGAHIVIACCFCIIYFQCVLDFCINNATTLQKLAREKDMLEAVRSLDILGGVEIKLKLWDKHISCIFLQE